MDGNVTEEIKSSDVGKDSEEAAGLFTFGDGIDATVLVKDTLEYVEKFGGGLIDDEVLEKTPLGGGLMRLVPHLEAMSTDSEFEYSEDTDIPIPTSWSMDGLRADIPYYVLFSQDDSGGYADDNPADVIVCACDAGALHTKRPDDWSTVSVSLTFEDGAPLTSDSVVFVETSEDEAGSTYTLADFGLDPQKLVSFYNVSSGNYVRFSDLLSGLLILRASVGVAMQMRGRRKAPEQDPPALEAIAPKKHLVSNSKPIHVLRHGQSPLLFEEEGAVLKVDRKSTQIQFALWQDEEASIEVSDKIDAEDVAVIEAVSTLKHAGNTVITPGQIIRNMGYKQSTSALVEEIHQRVLRLMSIKGRIDWTQQAKAWNLRNPDTGEPYEHAEIIGNLLNINVFDGTDVKGNRDIRYRVASDPITYEHARLVHQVIEYPPNLLDIVPIDEDGNEVKRVNRDQKKLERAILWYVFSLKNRKNGMNNYVTYEALFDYEGMKVNSDSSRKRAVKFVQAYLRALQRAGVIYAFTPEIERSRRHKQLGVTIHVEK